jgi:hypothetical protein
MFDRPLIQCCLNARCLGVHASRCILAVLALLVAAPTVLADESDPILLGQDKVKFSVGGFLTKMSTGLELSVVDDDKNKVIDVENDLGLSSSRNTFRIDGYWRPGPRHRIVVGYYSLSRSVVNTLETEIEWEDALYPVGVNIDTGLRLQVIPISYAYSFIKNERWELAASIGFHWTEVNTYISGDAFVGDDTVLSKDIRSSDVKGPFPLIGLLVDFSPAPKWQIGTTLQYLDLSVGKYHGRLVDLRAYVEYYIWRDVGVGLSYNFYDIHADVTEEDFTGKIDLQFDGALLYLTAKF